MSEWITVISSQTSKPAEIDILSSAYYVYERKLITAYTQYSNSNPEDIEFTGWRYLERKIPREQWLLETTAQNKLNSDAIMAGMVDLYELQLEGIGG